MSAMILDRERQRCLDEGFDGFVAKPFRLDRVYEFLDRLPAASWDSRSDTPSPTAADPEVDYSDDQLPSRARVRTDLVTRLMLELEIAQCLALSRERDQLAGRLSMISANEAEHWGLDQARHGRIQRQHHPGRPPHGDSPHQDLSKAGQGREVRHRQIDEAFLNQSIKRPDR